MEETQIQQMDESERYCYNPTLRWHPEIEKYFTKAFGAAHFSRISRALVCPCSYSCIRVNTMKTTANAVVKKLSAIVGKTSCRNAGAIVNEGTYDTFIQSDAAIAIVNEGTHDTFIQSDAAIQGIMDHCSGSNPSSRENTHSSIKRMDVASIVKCQFSGLDNVVFVRGSGPHKIQYDHTHAAQPKEVIVSRKCAEAVLRGAQVFVPGILACSSHVEKGDTVAVSVALEHKNSDGAWSTGITRGTVLQGCQTDPYYLDRRGFYIGRGVAMMSRTGFFRVPHGLAISMTERVFELPSFNDVLEGEIFLQNLPSIITAHILDPQKGEKILDMCAAPGGKTTAIAILVEDEGEIIAIDRSHNKVLDIQNLAAEMGLKSILTYKLDASRAVCRRSNISNEYNFYNDISSSRLSQNMSLLQLHSSGGCNVVSENPFEQQTDFTPANGCCKGSPSREHAKKIIHRSRNGPGRNQFVGGRVDKSVGLSPNSFDRVLLDAPCSALGLRPRLFTGEETLESLRNHAKYQKRMLDQAVQLVRPGGVLVYSTCTINPGENEGVVRYALDTYEFLTLALQHPRVGGDGLVGSCCWPDGYVEEWLRPGEEGFVQRFDPSSPLDTVGFFIAKFSVGFPSSG